MKCAACGYEKNNDMEFRYEKIHYYTHGKKKGEIKNITQEVYDPEKSKPDFIVLELEQEFQFHGSGDIYNFSSSRSVDLYACPQCGTVKIDVNNIRW